MNFFEYTVKHIGTDKEHARQGVRKPREGDVVIRTDQGTKGFWWYVEKSGNYGAWFKDCQVEQLYVYLTPKGVCLLQRKIGKKPVYWIMDSFGEVLKKGLRSRKEADPLAQGLAEKHGPIYLFAVFNRIPCGVVKKFVG